MTEAPLAARPPRRAALIFIFVTVVIDVLAFGLIIPVLPRLIEQFRGGDTAHAAETWGLFATAWALMQFLFSPFLGALSDRWGRRPVILISCLGLGLDYIVMALAPTVGWLLLGRILSGITASSFSVSAAYVADITPPDKRAAGFGMLGAAFGLGFVVGPGELSYLAAVAPLYRLLGVPQPVFVPRSSLTVVEPSMQRGLQRFSLDLPDLTETPERLAEKLLQNDEEGGGDIEDMVEDIKHRLRADLDAVEKKLAALDSSMTGALDRARTKSAEELDRLQNKVRNARQNREGTGIKQLRRLCNSLRPRARMQERVFGPVTFLNAHGAKLADELIGAADPFRIEHGVLEL